MANKLNFNKEVALAKKKAKASFAKAKVEFAKAKVNMAKAEKNAEKYVSKNPKKAVAIAAGVGAAIGAITIALLKHSKK